MRSEPPPFRDVCSDLVSISSAKNDPRRKRLRRLRPHLQKRYADYWEARTSLETLARRDWSAPAEDAMQHCYTGNTRARTEMLEGLMKQIKQEPNLCPYCLIRQPKSLDHFLPKDFYPELSVLAWNLVWVCDPCNRRKGNRLVDAPRQVINPYFDVIPETALLHADVTVTVDGVAVRYRVQAFDPAVPADVVELMRRHYAALALDNDYVAEGAAVVSDLVNSISAQFREAINQEQLDAAIDNRMREWGEYPVNCFRVAVVEALETCEGLLGYVNQRIAAAPRPQRARPLRDLAALRASAAVRASEI
jgi:5-methylcytosine-specific restriction endonuclease McrA